MITTWLLLCVEMSCDLHADTCPPREETAADTFFVGDRSDGRAAAAFRPLNAQRPVSSVTFTDPRPPRFPPRLLLFSFPLNPIRPGRGIKKPPSYSKWGRAAFILTWSQWNQSSVTETVGVLGADRSERMDSAAAWHISQPLLAPTSYY